MKTVNFNGERWNLLKVEGSTVGDVVAALKEFPQDAEFELCGEQGSSMIVIKTDSGVSLDCTKYIEETLGVDIDYIADVSINK